MARNDDSPKQFVVIFRDSMDGEHRLSVYSNDEFFVIAARYAEARFSHPRPYIFQTPAGAVNYKCSETATEVCWLYYHPETLCD